jgi:hypothetical protein
VSKYFFIGGLHRSGTTLIARVLGQHPMIASLTGTGVPEDEGQHLQSVYAPAERHGGWGRFAYRDRAHLTESSPLVSPESAARMEAAWVPYWSDPDAPIRLEKSPPNLVQLRFLQALWPDASFLVVIRHPVAVTLATRKQMKRSRNPVRRFSPDIRVLRHWERAYSIAQSDLEQVGATVVRYEDFVADPGAESDRIFAAMGLGSFAVDAKIDPDANSRYLNAWTGSDEWVRYPTSRRYGYA